MAVDKSFNGFKVEFTPDGLELSEQAILTVRMEAAQMECEAAKVRLATAHKERESCERTIAMTNLVADSMMSREAMPDPHISMGSQARRTNS